MVKFFTSTFTLLTNHRKPQYIFSLLLSNYQPNAKKNTHKFSFFKKEKKPTLTFPIPLTPLNPNSR